MRFAFATLSATTLSVLAGCSANVASSSEAVDAETLSPATAIVVVERTTDSTSEGTRANAVARFVRTRAGIVDDRALELVGANVDFPAMDACSELPIAQEATTEPARVVELADVGDIAIETPAAQTNLLARQQPDVADLLSGVVYAARANEGSALPPSVRYVVHGGGTSVDIAPFLVAADAPAEIASLEIDGARAENDTMTIAADAPVDVRWQAGAADDIVYIDIAAGKAATASARCLFSDSGHATIPAATLASIDEGTLRIHRLHREDFRASGIDAGEMRFDFARVVAFARH